MNFFFNFDVFSTFILNVLSFKVDFCYLDEQILIAVVRKTSKIELLCFLGILSCKFWVQTRVEYLVKKLTKKKEVYWKPLKKYFGKKEKKRLGVFLYIFLLNLVFLTDFHRIRAIYTFPRARGAGDEIVFSYNVSFIQLFYIFFNFFLH